LQITRSSIHESLNRNERSHFLRALRQSTLTDPFGPAKATAADLIKLAMIRIHDAIREQHLRGRMLLQVHDELVLEAPPEEVDPMRELVCTHMEGVVELAVPLVVDIGVGDNWLDAKR
jgi:DNA polymerase-1